MSAPEDDVSVDADGVSVRKTVNDHQFETLAVVFDIRSGRDGPAEVSVTDEVPGEVVQDDIGFHPEYGGEHWRAGSGTVTFTRTFEPGEQYTTVYGIRDFDSESAELLSEPTVEVDAGSGAGGVEDVDELVTEDDGDPVRDVITGERDLLPGIDEKPAGDEPAPGRPAEGEAAETAGAGAEPGIAEAADVEDGAVDADAGPADAEGEPGTADAGGAEAGDETADEGTEGAGVGDDGPAVREAAVEGAGETPGTQAGDVAETDEAPGDEVTVPVTGGIGRVLAKELRSGNVAPEDRRLLREELLPDEGSTDARIRHLQQEVTDLVAYTDAIEAFLDEEGGAEAVVGRLEDELDDVAGDVRDLDDDLSGVADSLDEVDSTVGDLEDDVQDVGEDLSGVEDSLDEVDSTVGDLSDDVGRLDDELAAVSDDVSDVSGRVDGLASDLERVEDDLGQLDSLSGRLGGVEDDVASIRDELSDLAAFRDQLSSVFGTGGGVGGSGSDVDEGDHRNGG